MKKVIFTSLCILMTNFVVTNFALAANLTDEQKEKITENCQVAQSTLQRIGNSDTTARINRGRDYDQVLKLLYAMNTRVSSNNITEPRLTELTKQFEEKLADFRSNYNKHNDNLKSTYEMNCSRNVNTFYDNLNKTRDSRAVINADIVGLDTIIDNYQQVVEELVQ
jgi:hypothetical protein